MGAYENPIQAIDDKSGMIIANAISNVGQQTAQFIHRYYDDQNKEVEKARKEEEDRLAALEKNRDKLHASIENAGGRSQSIFDIADLAINTKYDYEGKLKNATTDEERIEYTKEINKQKSIIRTLTQGISDIQEWKKTNGKRVMDQNTNDPGGIYTGSCSEDSSEFNKKICQDYTRKQAIMGTLTKDGNLVQGVKYSIKFEEVDGIEVPSLWATIPGGSPEGFHVSNTLIHDYAEVENVFAGPDGINAKTKEMGLQNSSGIYGPAYVQKPLEVFTKSQDGQDLSRWIQPLNTEAIVNTLKPQYQTHFLSMVDSIDNEADYNDLVATYLSYVKNGEALETVKPGVWKLTTQAKEKFVHDMVQIALTDKIPSYQSINAVREGDEVIYLDGNGNEVRTTENENWIYDKKTGKVIGRADAQKEMEKGNIGKWEKDEEDKKGEKDFGSLDKSDVQKYNRIKNNFEGALQYGVEDGFDFMKGAGKKIGKWAIAKTELKDGKLTLFGKESGKKKLGPIGGWNKIDIQKDKNKLRDLARIYAGSIYGSDLTPTNRDIILDQLVLDFESLLEGYEGGRNKVKEKLKNKVTELKDKFASPPNKTSGPFGATVPPHEQ